MKKVWLILTLLVGVSMTAFSQNYNREKNAWLNYVIRVYNHAPFEGVKIVDDNVNKYLICVLSLDASKYQDESQINRVASVKAQALASRFFNGSSVSSDLVIKTTEEGNGEVSTEFIETIKENSIGYVKSLEQLTNFKNDAGRDVFIFSTPINQ